MFSASTERSGGEPSSDFSAHNIVESMEGGNWGWIQNPAMSSRVTGGDSGEGFASALGPYVQDSGTHPA